MTKEAKRKAIWDSKPYQPDGIVDAKTLLKEVTTPQKESDYDYPYDGLNRKLRGIRRSSLITFTSGTGQGKSTITREIATHLLNKGERVGFLDLEASNRQTALGLMSTAVGQPLHIGEHNEEELTTAFYNSIDDWNLQQEFELLLRHLRENTLLELQPQTRNRNKEGLNDLINSETESQFSLSMSQYEGALSSKINLWRDEVVWLLSKLEALIDFFR